MRLSKKFSYIFGFFSLANMIFSERVGFEPTDGVNHRKFSKLLL